MLAFLLLAQTPLASATFTVDGVARTALVHAPKKSEGAPVVFAFHGHGGNDRNAARKFRIHAEWPEAFVVYPRGLPTPGRYDLQGKKNGWQKELGEQKDRDLKFFDAMLRELSSRKADMSRVYVTGHSNGGGFTYLLWAQRSKQIAAVAPSAAGARSLADLEPKPCLHIAGRNDERVLFANQERVMQAVQRVNGCTIPPKPWGEFGNWYESDKGAPFVSVITNGGHEMPDASGRWIVEFFKKCGKTY